LNKAILIPGFILMVLVQLYVPVRMIFHKESVLTTGTEYKFRTAPIDPNDPFRGKYISLNFNANAVKVADAEDWMNGDQVFVDLTTDSLGYASVLSVSKSEPTGYENYIKANISYVITDSLLSTVFIQYPFDRYYMEESKAQVAQDSYNAAAIDSNQVAYALVLVKNGEAIVKDVYINDTLIVEWARIHQDNPQ
jgi:uncharacterized membrane-anchored protein